MIARDEEAVIGRALASVADLVDEFVVLDTGSVDATVEVARSAGARVEQFAWCDDFAAAKNAALALARCPWRLVLDADEWVASGTLTADDLGSADGAVGAVLMEERLVPSDGGFEQVSTSWIPRLLPEKTRYAGRIHEQVVSGGRAWHTRLVLGHDGYSPARNRAKAGRNEALLRASLAENPTDAYYIWQLAKDLEVQERFEESAQWYCAARDATTDRDPWGHELQTRGLYVLGRAGRFQDAMAWFAEAERVWPRSPDLYFVMADLMLDRATADPGHATSYVAMMRRLWQRCLDIGERPELAGSVQGRGSHLARQNLELLDGLERELPVASRGPSS